VTADFAGDQPAPVRLRVAGAGLAMPDAGFSLDGVNGEIAFTGFSPLATLPDQKLSATRLKVGDVELSDGTVEFAMSASDTMNVKHTEWKWLAGRIWADDVRLAPGEPIRITLHAQDVELRDLLAQFAQDKASGQGRLSGQIPITVDANSNVKFGEGMFTAFQGGNVQVKDADTLQTTAQAAAAAVGGLSSDQVKKNVIEALGDFQYDKLSARMAEETGKGLVGHVRMAGRGRRGAKQALAYDLNVTGLDDLLRSYVKIRGAVSAPPSTRPTTRPARPATTRKADST
jgi:hypothetical protein